MALLAGNTYKSTFLLIADDTQILVLILNMIFSKLTFFSEEHKQNCYVQYEEMPTTEVTKNDLTWRKTMDIG